MQPPASFLALQTAGRFDYWGGRRYAELDKATRARLYVERRHVVLWLREVEFDVDTAAELVEHDDARPGLFPIAHTGAGDAYALYPAWQRGAPEAPILLVPHDASTSQVFAPTFATMLYRLWLQMAVDWSPQYDGDQREADLAAWGGIIAPVLEQPWQATLISLAAAPDVAAVRAALDTLVATLPTDSLATMLEPVHCNPKFVKGEAAVRAYARSIAFYEALVAEGHTRFAAQVAEAIANRDAAGAR